MTDTTNTEATNTEATTEEATNPVSSVFDSVKGYMDAVVANPFHHLASAAIGAGVMRRVDTGILKRELSEQAYSKVKSQLVLGSLPIVNA